MSTVFRPLVAGAVFVVLIVFVMATGPESQTDTIDSAIRIGEFNELAADSAPQQQVVNGWVARDLLEIQATQLDDANAARRTTNLLLAGLVAVLVFAAFQNDPEPETAPTVGLADASSA